MARQRRVTFGESAIADLEEIQTWHVGQGVSAAGMRVVTELVAQAERLAAVPESGRVVPEFGTSQLREVIHPPYRMVYRLDRDEVRMVRVWRGQPFLTRPPG